jgi:UDPglucose 6-dehydrogenase
VAVVGLGYVGLVTGTCLARLGQEVVGLESDRTKLQTLEAGDVPYYEPHLEAELAAQKASGRLRFTGAASDALGDAEIVLICVGTPSDATGHADLRFVLEVAETIAQTVDHDPLVVIRSTVPVGTTRRVQAGLNSARAARGLPPLQVVANPEFLRTGRAIEDFLRPTRVVIGRTDLTTNLGLDRLNTLYAPLEAPIVITDAESAELVKNASNAFLAMRVSFVNELASLCEAAGADVDDVIEGMSLDPRIGGQFMRPGIGYGGSCLPKDVRSLVATGADHGVRMRIAAATDEVNRGQAERLVDALAAGLGRPIEGARIAVLGLAFKPDTDDIRESPALAVLDLLHERGADVVATDPEAMARVRTTRPWLETAVDPMDAARDADAIVLATEWPAYLTLDVEALATTMGGRLIVDGRNALDAAKVVAAGLDYMGVGRRRPRPDSPDLHGQSEPASV